MSNGAIILVRSARVGPFFVVPQRIFNFQFFRINSEALQFSLPWLIARRRSPKDNMPGFPC